MEAIKGYKIFQVSEYEWYAAKNMYDAVKEYMRDTGYEFQHCCDEQLHELSDNEASTLKYCDPEESNATWTFKDRLDYELKAFENNKINAWMFASTES